MSHLTVDSSDHIVNLRALYGLWAGKTIRLDNAVSRAISVQADHLLGWKRSPCKKHVAKEQLRTIGLK